MINEVLKWIEEQGGPPGVKPVNREKAVSYMMISTAAKASTAAVAEERQRSDHEYNVPFASEELEKQFVKASEQEGFVGLKGHRSVGGLRASAYNAVPHESVRHSLEFMRHFRKLKGNLCKMTFMTFRQAAEGFFLPGHPE